MTALTNAQSKESHVQTATTTTRGRLLCSSSNSAASVVYFVRGYTNIGYLSVSSSHDDARSGAVVLFPGGACDRQYWYCLQWNDSRLQVQEGYVLFFVFSL